MAYGMQVLDLTGSRDFLTKESAEEVLRPMLVPGSAIHKVKFSTKSFGRDAANVAATGIKNCKASLVDADISDVIAGRPVGAPSGDMPVPMHAAAVDVGHLPPHGRADWH